MIVGICGKMGSGKTTLAENLMDYYVLAEQHAFADKLKEIARDLFGVEKKDSFGRVILQMVGSKMREIDPLVWVKYVLKKIDKIDPFLHIITDVRYENEARSILERDGIVIVLNVPDDIRRDRIERRDGIHFDDSEWNTKNSHPSETGVDAIKKIESNRVVTLTTATASEVDVRDIAIEIIDHYLNV